MDRRGGKASAKSLSAGGQALAEGIDDDIQQMADLLGVEVINSKVFAMIGELLIKELDAACTK